MFSETLYICQLFPLPTHSLANAFSCQRILLPTHSLAKPVLAKPFS